MRLNARSTKLFDATILRALWFVLLGLVSSLARTALADEVFLGDAPVRFESQETKGWKSVPKAAKTRADVVALFNNVYTPGNAVPLSWTGSIAGCIPGTTNIEHQQATIDRVNYFRALVDLPPVTLLPGVPTTQSQAAALTFAANNALSHFPPPSWLCYSADGAAAAGNSNIALGTYMRGPKAIDAYMFESGSNNYAVGHRRWVLFPPRAAMATGDIPLGTSNNAANALYVQGPQTTRPATPNGIAWPPAGYVPYQNLPVESNRWSFSYPGADFTNATVTMSGPGGSIATTRETVANGYGDNTIVFLPSAVSYSRPAGDTAYSIRVGNIAGAGVPATIQYTVTVIDPTPGPSAPAATTVAASAIGTTGTTLNGTVGSNGASTTVTFQYGLTTSYGSNVTAAQSPLAAGAANTAVSAAISGLTCNTTYHFRVVASNSSGTTNGSDATLITGACAVTAPTVQTTWSNNLTATGATLGGTVSSNGASTTVTFQYGATASYGSSVSATQSPLAAGATNATVSAAVSGLTCNTTYHLRVVAVNSASTTYGPHTTFATAACGASAPTATTTLASGIAATAATLNGAVSSNGASTSVTFQYGLTTGYGSGVTAAQSPLVAAATSAAVSAAISALTCNTTYHFRVVAVSSAGTSYGADATFKTAGCTASPPTVTTGAASAIGTTGATLNGTVSSNGASAMVTFHYGPTTGYGSTAGAAQSPLAAGAVSAAVSAAISGLTCNSTYHFRVVATNSADTTSGTDATFTSAACSVTIPSPPTVVTATAGNGQASVSFSPPVDNGGSPITGYTVTSSPAGGIDAHAGSTAITHTITGLTNGVAYTFVVRATSAIGTSAPSAPSNSVTPSGSDDNFPPGGRVPGGWIIPSIADAGWVLAGDSAYQGSSSLRSASIGGSQMAAIQVSGIFLAGDIAFAARVSSEFGYDYFEFYVDDELVFYGSGEVGWTPLSVPVTGGTHTFRWVYIKDESFSSGTDAAWIDSVVMPPATGVSLGVARVGNGTGTVTSNPSGIECPSDCNEIHATGTSVKLVATPAAGSVFSGWGGACTGTGICPVSMTSARSVTATFTFVGAGSANSNRWVQRSYVAYYGRPADPAGLAWWAARMDQEGGSLASIIAAFGTSAEFDRRYGGLTYSQLIDSLYQQTLGRAPDPGGKQWYLDQLNAGRTTLQTITLDLLGGATGLDALTVANRLDVANHYTGKVGAGCPYNGELTGVASLTPVTFESAATWTAKLAIESRCGP